MPEQFSWIPFYRELAQRTLTFEDKQDELIALLHEMDSARLPVIPLQDDQHDGSRVLLTVIDPFTFLANFARTYNESTLRLCQWIKERWNLSTELPTDFDGLAGLNARNSWFFSSTEGGRSKSRRPDDIPLLWRLARAAFNSNVDQLDATLYAECKDIPNCGLRKLTTGLFWISPSGFLPLGGDILKFLKARGVDWNRKKLWDYDLAAYRALIRSANNVNYNHAALVYESQQWASNHRSDVSVPEGPLLNYPLNTILYGPPGTGKTFESVARAVKIIDGETPENREECMERFEELRQAEQIGFVTFHQSFSYEEFIEGLRPVADEETEEGARYKVQDGIFKQMALRALAATLRFPVVNKTSDPTFDELWDEFTSRIVEKPDYKISGLGNSEFLLTIAPGGGVRGENLAGKAKEPYSASFKNVQQVWEELPVDAAPNYPAVSSILQKGSHHFLIGAIIEELRRIAATEGTTLSDGSLRVERPLTIEDARKWLKGKSDLEEREGEPPRFVLIVDEINRGNISKIFGELITLLEEDKRLGETNQLKVILPYSTDTFGLPPNLYLLGTMNTADKSLALLDVALRRRFDFEEVRPDFADQTICTDLTPVMRQVLIEINRRIMLVLDREHRLGHSFFIGVATSDEFNTVFERKIVPLLQEYFYNDWEGLCSVLGEKESGAMVCKIPSDDAVRGRNHYAWWHDLDKPTPDFFARLCANYNISESTPVVTADNVGNAPAEATPVGATSETSPASA